MAEGIPTPLWAQLVVERWDAGGREVFHYALLKEARAMLAQTRAWRTARWPDG